MINLFNRKKDIKNYIEEGKELNFKNLFEKIKELQKENEKLNEENYGWMESSGYIEYLCDKLENENKSLKDKVKEQDKLLSKTTKENALMNDHIEKLEDDLKDFYKMQDKKIEEYEDKYNERMLCSKLEKTTKEKDTYKEVINKICDKYSINHKEVFSIIDNIQENKIERER